MFNYVLFVLIATALVLAYFVFRGTNVKFINEIGYEATRRSFVLFGVVFMIISMVVSRLTHESLAFSFFGVYFDDEYSTLIWAIIYFVILYVSIFEEFHLNGWIVSKSKTWKTIDEAQLMKLTIMVAEEVMAGLLSKEDIFMNAILNLEILQKDSIELNFAQTELFDKNFCNIYYHCKDERIDKFVDGIIDLINLKQN